MISDKVISESTSEMLDRGSLKRSCSRREEQESQETDPELLSDDNSSEAGDNSSDEDFSLTRRKPKKKKKKVKPNRTRQDSEKKSRRSKTSAPSFDEVMEVQINHAQKFMNYEVYESDSSSINGELEAQEILKSVQEKSHSPEIEPEPPREKRKKIIIYPWNPIGITGGRPRQPITDVSNLKLEQ